MTRIVAAVMLTGALVASAVVVKAAGLPLWAYGYTVAPAENAEIITCTAANPFDCARRQLPPNDGKPHSVPGSKLQFTVPQVYDDYGPADWFPEDHGPMPPIVANGRKANGVTACSLCHLPNGHGKPENAPVAGFSVDYIMRQLADFKSGARKSANPRKFNTSEMVAIAQAITPEEAKAAAEFFAAIKFKPWIKVVESPTTPKYQQTLNGLFMPAPGGGTEPIGVRLVELPENVPETSLHRNTRTGFVVYAPPGSIKKGQMLATTGAAVVDGKDVPGRTMPCNICHGPELKGIGDVPGIAGRQASYLARQLYDMQQGARNGQQMALMKPVVANLTEEDLVNLVAYVSSLQP